jgi:Flp pilus assembly protein TadD
MRVAAALLLACVAAEPVLAAEKPRRDAAVEALSNPERLVQIGNHGRASADYMLALSFYERALAIDPDFVPALRAATEVALAVRLPQAQAYAERWVSKAPRDGLAHLAVGAALVQQNRPAEAMKSIGLAAAAGGPPAAIAVQRGLAFDLLGESRNAQIAFADALQQAPGDRTIVEYLALSLAIGGDDAAATQLLRPEAEKAVGQPSFERTVVLVHALAGRIDQARRIAAANLPPQSARSVGELLQRVASLPDARRKAAAIHLGILPDAGQASVPVASADREAPPVPITVARTPSDDTAPVRPATARPVVVEPVPAIVRAGPKPAASPPPAPKPAVLRPPPKPEPMPAGMLRLSPAALKAEHVWLQLASSPDRAMLATDHARLKKKARGMLNGYNAYVQHAGTTHRLLVGPFKSMADAMRASGRLKAAGINTLASRIPAGSTIGPL